MTDTDNDTAADSATGTTAAARLRATLVQTDLAWEQPAVNRDRLGALLAPLAGKTDLVVLPEAFPTGFTQDGARLAEPMEGPTVDWLRAQARALDAAVAGSAFIRAAKGGVYNRFLWAFPDGEVRYYDKRHLFRMAGEHERYAPGSAALVLDWRGVSFCPLVCYDLRFPVWSRRRPGLDYDVLVYVANWPKPRVDAWSALLAARAIENQAIVVGVNRVGPDGQGIDYTGASAVHDALGRPVLELGGDDAVRTVVLDVAATRRFRDRFPVHMDADRFTLATT